MPSIPLFIHSFNLPICTLPTQSRVSHLLQQRLSHPAYPHQTGKYFWALFSGVCILLIFKFCVMKTIAILNMVSQTIYISPPSTSCSPIITAHKEAGFPSNGVGAALIHNIPDQRVSLLGQTWGSLTLSGSQLPGPSLFYAGGRGRLTTRASLCSRVRKPLKSFLFFLFYIFVPRKFQKCFSDSSSPNSILFLCFSWYLWTFEGI